MEANELGQITRGCGFIPRRLELGRRRRAAEVLGGFELLRFFVLCGGMLRSIFPWNPHGLPHALGARAFLVYHSAATPTCSTLRGGHLLTAPPS